MTAPETLHEETPDFGVTFKCEAKPEHVHNHPVFDLHAETLTYLTGVVDAYPEMPGREQYAYAAQCVKDVQALREQVADLQALNAREVKSGAELLRQRDKYRDDVLALRAENARLASLAEIVEAMDEGRIAQVVSKAGLKRAVMLWLDDDRCFSGDTTLAAYHAARAGRTDAP